MAFSLPGIFDRIPVMRSHWTRLLLIVCAVALLTAAYERANAPGVMSDAAHAYLNALTPALRSRAVIPFASDERENWHFIPLDNRKGIALREMTSAQKHLAEALLSAGLSQQGLIRAHTIMSLEDVLKGLEKGQGPERDPEKYFLTIFGEPSEQGTWGYRFEGHHVSLNFTVVNGRVVSSPSFFGANPETVKEGPRAGLRALAREEDLGRELIKALTGEQRAIAIVDKTAYKDILTSDSRKAALNGQPNGLPFAKFTARQKEILTELVTDYAANFPQVVADARLDQFRKTQDKLFFAWSGGMERGQPHYYRIQTPAFLIEFDDTQDNANHIHSVWRDFNGDFGLDLLAQHYQQSH
jgi:hypothetical protein